MGTEVYGTVCWDGITPHQQPNRFKQRLPVADNETGADSGTAGTDSDTEADSGTAGTDSDTEADVHSFTASDVTNAFKSVENKPHPYLTRSISTNTFLIPKSALTKSKSFTSKGGASITSLNVNLLECIDYPLVFTSKPKNTMVRSLSYTSPGFNI